MRTRRPVDKVIAQDPPVARGSVGCPVCHYTVAGTTTVAARVFAPWHLGQVPLRPNRVELVGANRDLVRNRHPPGYQPWHVHFGERTRIRDYVDHWNADADADEILAKVRWGQTSGEQLVQNNSK